MAFIGLAALLALISVVAWIFIILHAFQRSVGTGFLVLCVPCYVLWYAFSQFEHPKKGLILAVWLGAGVAAALLYGAAGASMPRYAPPQAFP